MLNILFREEKKEIKSLRNCPSTYNAVQRSDLNTKVMRILGFEIFVPKELIIS